MEYSVAIRTLGTAGEKYQLLLDSLYAQTIRPKGIYVYIAEGYSLPKETIGIEQYVYVKKGMLNQRAQKYDEIDTEYILFLDDDLYLPTDTVEIMFSLLSREGAHVISPDILPNHNKGYKGTLQMLLSGRMRPRCNDDYWGYKVMRNSGYSYNQNPINDVYVSQTNAGACFLCKKDDFLKIHLEEELWLDEVAYPIGEDQVMYYKMYKKGLKLLTWYNHKVRHLDAGMNMHKDKQLKLIFSDFRFKIIFWHRFIFKPEKYFLINTLNVISITYSLGFSLIISILKFQFDVLKIKIAGIKSAWKFLDSDTYMNLPKV